MGKIAWGITGAGHFLKESLALIEELEEVVPFISPAGREVIGIYSLKSPKGAFIDKSASTAMCRSFASGIYDVFVVAPATSNSVAKFVCGISDSMISTLFAQSGKSGVPIIVLPSDTGEIVDTMGATKPLKIYPRPVDIENVERLKRFEGVTVVFEPAEVRLALARLLRKG